MAVNPRRAGVEAILRTSVEQDELHLECQASELFRIACFAGYGEDTAWAAVQALQRQGTGEVFSLALDHLKSVEPLHRARALDVLAQLHGDRPVSDYVTPALASLADSDPQVVCSAAWVLAARAEDPRSIPALLALRGHALPAVREAAVNGLYMRQPPGFEALLMELMKDPDDDVRNWATFGLGEFGPDSVEICEALRQRLNDLFEDVRDEALWGFARRRDPDGLRRLLLRIDADEWREGDDSAARQALGLSGDVTPDEIREGMLRLLRS